MFCWQLFFAVIIHNLQSKSSHYKMNIDFLCYCVRFSFPSNWKNSRASNYIKNQPLLTQCQPCFHAASDKVAEMNLVTKKNQCGRMFASPQKKTTDGPYIMYQVCQKKYTHLMSIKIVTIALILEI